MITQLKHFIDNKLEEGFSFEIDNKTVAIIKQFIRDEDYFEFVASVGNGGFFFGQSLQFYSLVKEDEKFRSIVSVNNTLKEAFDFLFKGLYSFAQDIFGNQFAFNLDNGAVIFFNIETGGREVLAQGFKDWLSILTADLEYFTGMSYENEWKDRYPISLDQRIQPKIPFVIGGDYAIENFYVNNYPGYLLYNSDIAKQVYNLKDGQKVKLKIKGLE